MSTQPRFDAGPATDGREGCSMRLPSYGADAGRRHRGRKWRGATSLRRPATESSIEAAVAEGEQDGLRFLLRVRLVVLAALAVWLITNYVLLRSVLGLLAVVA